MELARLIDALRDPAAYPDQVEGVEVRQTHISVVFLAGSHVYKIKKPVDLGFVDFSTPERRRHFCEEEVRLNARLAADVYRGVVPIVATADGLRVEGPGEAVEWAVKMRRLPDEATLESRLERGAVTPGLIAAVAEKIAAFHDRAESSPHISAFGRVDVVGRNARENFEQSAPHVGRTLSRAVCERLAARTEEVLAELAGVIDARARRGVPRDTHGDLRLDHVYLLDDASADASLVIIDCIEFNEQFRFADPVSDLAFLAMDLKYEGRDDLADALTQAYFAARGDAEGRLLMPFYIAYRAAVRGKVEGFRQAEPEVPKRDRDEALLRGRGYWLLALGELEPARRKPCLVLVGGLPGSGKSTLAAAIAERGGFEVIRSDVVRKELAHDAPTAAPAAFASGIYSDAWNDRTYAECLRRVEDRLFEGARVVVDASFREEARRRAFLEAAARRQVPAVLLLCQADAEVIRSRLAARRDDASDADWAIHQQAAAVWQPPGEHTRASLHTIDTSGTRQQAAEQAHDVLSARGLVS